MLKRQFTKYLQEGFSNKESEHLSLSDYCGFVYYSYRKEIEYILQVIKQNFEQGNFIGQFDVNSIPGCNIPYAEAVIIKIDNDFNNSYGEYNVEHNQHYDENGELIIPAPDADPNYDSISQKIKEALIEIHVTPDNNGKFPESKYRQTIAHELNHLRDDYEIRKSTNNDWSLLKVYVVGNIDVSKKFYIL